MTKLSNEYHRIVQMQNERGDTEARHLLAEEIVKLREALEATACMVKAEPELLEACLLLMRAEPMQSGVRDGATMGDISIAIDAARAAIAKAKGRPEPLTIQPGTPNFNLDEIRRAYAVLPAVVGDRRAVIVHSIDGRGDGETVGVQFWTEEEIARRVLTNERRTVSSFIANLKPQERE